MTVRRLTSLDHHEIAELARNAAENAVPLHDANVFEEGTAQHQSFTHAYRSRQRELQAFEA